MGIEIPTSNSLNDTFVTVRNPWATDTGSLFFDADQNGTLSDTELRNSRSGIDGTNDGLIRLPWSVFAANFEATRVSSRTGPNINTPLPVDSFSKPSPVAVTVYEGQRLRVDVPTTHSSGRPVYYRMNSFRGIMHLQDGILEWEPEAASAGRYAVSICAVLDPLNPLITTDIAFIVTVLPSGTTIGSVTASPTTIKNDGSELLTLTANNFQSPTGESVAVVWVVHSQNSFFIKKLQWYNANGSPQGAAIVIATNVEDPSNLRIVGDSAGNLLVVYNVGGYFTEDIWALSVARDGSVARAPWQVKTNTVNAQKNPTMALNDDGVGVIAWSDFQDASLGAPNQTVARQVWNYGAERG